jgi:uncharacterized phage protein gp47/JayE
MRAALGISEPDLDTSIGTTARKIIDAVAEVAAEVSVDKYLLDYQYDIDTKTGADLEDFARLFGFSRLAAKRATGVVTLERSSPATQNIIIPVGTQVASDTTPRVIFASVIPAILIAGESAVDIPVQAIAAGAIGNVSAHSIERFVSPIEGITSFSNDAATTGGTDAESDEALRSRFKRTIFRNLAGTEAMFLGVALEHESVTQANVIGASKRHTERVEVVTGSAVSTVQDAKSVYAGTSIVGPDIRNGDILTPGIHYQFDATNPPAIYSLDAAVMPDGIYDLEFEYVPQASRNDPTNGITNRIDVYVTGTKATEAIETRQFSNARTFTNAVGSPLDRANFRRIDGTMPTLGNYFLALANSPVLDPSIPNQITIGPNTYVEGTDYYLVNDVSAFGGARQSLSGIEWISAANGAPQAIPANGVAFTTTYTFNAVPREVEVSLRDWRLVCTDVWVHQANLVRLNIHLAVILEPGFSLASVQPTLEFDLQNLLSTVGFNGVLQTSDILAVAHNVAGVDAVRLLTSADDPTDYAIIEVAEDGTPLHTYATASVPSRAIDVLTGDSEIVVLNDLVVVVKAQNTFGSA